MSFITSPGSFGRWLTGFSGALASILLPADCRVCEKPLEHARRVPLCEDCLRSIAPLRGAVCRVCGYPHLGEEDELPFQELCTVCQQRKFPFDAARSFAFYEGTLVRAMLLFKYEKIPPLGSLFAAYLAHVVAREPAFQTVDLIVPVPLHSARRRERGFNQAELLARPLSKRLGIPCKTLLLTRIRPRPKKQTLQFEERWEAVRGAFAMKHGTRVDNSRILLLDDVMTTGATLSACARALKEGGAREVFGLTVARAVRPEDAVAGKL